jgi:hypothetical protein
MGSSRVPCFELVPGCGLDRLADRHHGHGRVGLGVRWVDRDSRFVDASRLVAFGRSRPETGASSLASRFGAGSSASSEIGCRSDWGAWRLLPPKRSSGCYTVRGSCAVTRAAAVPSGEALSSESASPSCSCRSRSWAVA